MDNRVHPCALMSALAYHPSDPKKSLGWAQQLANRGWQRNNSFFAAWLKLDNNEGKANDEGYYATVFVKASTKQLVIAHRGTVASERGNILADLLLLQLQHPNEIAVLAFSFVLFVKQRLEAAEKYLGYSLLQTGHSLGAFLAECSAALLWNDLQTQAEREKYCEVISFESPGAKTALQTHGIELEMLPTVHEYLANPNLINTACEHIGQHLFRVYGYSSYPNRSVKHEFSAPITGYDIGKLQILSQEHSIEKMINAFARGNTIPVKAKNWPQACNAILIGDTQRQVNEPFVYRTLGGFPGLSWELPVWLLLAGGALATQIGYDIGTTLLRDIGGEGIHHTLSYQESIQNGHWAFVIEHRRCRFCPRGVKQKDAHHLRCERKCSNCESIVRQTELCTHCSEERWCSCKTRSPDLLPPPVPKNKACHICEHECGGCKEILPWSTIHEDHERWCKAKRHHVLIDGICEGCERRCLRKSCQQLQRKEELHPRHERVCASGQHIVTNKYGCPYCEY